MKKYLVIGNPLEHSLSPKIHNFWFKENKINAIYNKETLEDEDLENFIEMIRDKKIEGANITVPFKEKIIKTIFISFSVFTITNTIAAIIATVLGLLFHTQFSNEEVYEKALIEYDKAHFELIEKLNDQIDSLNIAPIKNKEKIDSLKTELNRTEKMGNFFRKLKEEGDQIKSKTGIK